MTYQNVKRGQWSQSCSNCKHYKNGQCQLINRNMHPKDWCKDHKN